MKLSEYLNRKYLEKKNIVNNYSKFVKERQAKGKTINDHQRRKIELANIDLARWSRILQASKYDQKNALEVQLLDLERELKNQNHNYEFAMIESPKSQPYIKDAIEEIEFEIKTVKNILNNFQINILNNNLKE